MFMLCFCLLQIYDGKKKPEVLVDGWNVYFFDDLKALVSIHIFAYLCMWHYILVVMHVTPCLKNTSFLSTATCSPVVGHSMGRTLRLWGNCGSACFAFTLRNSISESMWSVSDSTPASPPSTSSGHLNTLSLKVSLHYTLGPDLFNKNTKRKFLITLV